MNARYSARFLLVLVISVLAMAQWSGRTVVMAAHSVTFAVNSTADALDATPGDGICDTAIGRCTLRAAIEEANVQPAASTITILVPSGAYDLTLGTLALISNTIVISGAGAGTTLVMGQG